MDKSEIADYLLEKHEIFKKGTNSIVIDGETVRIVSLDGFLTKQKLKDIDINLLVLESAERKALLKSVGALLFNKAEEFDDGEMSVEEEFPLPEDSILHKISQTSEDLMKYRPVKDVKSGDTHMFCLTSEMIAEMDVTSWLDLAPKSALKIKSQPCIAIYDPIEMRKCYAGRYSPTSEEGVEIEVLYINEHIKPDWRS